MALSDTACKNAHRHEKTSINKPFKLTDEKGLYLLLQPKGDGWGKWWRLKYRFGGKEKLLSLGIYPDTSLQQAREKRDAARKLLAEGTDPGESRKAEKIAAANTFEIVTRQWLASTVHLVGDNTQQKKTRRFERHVFSSIGDKPINEIKSADVLSVVKPLFTMLETAHRVHAEISAAFDYAIVHNFTDFNPAQSVAKQIPAKNVTHRAALIEPKDVGQLLRDISNYQGTFVVQCAFRLSPLLFQRPGEIRQMEWKDVDLEAKEWRYLVTKTKAQHLVPLSTQAIAILEEIKPLTGSVRYVFPSSRGDGRPMSDNTIRTALKSLGYDSDTMTAHGFRSTASTLLNEQGWSPDAIERQLCHMPKDQVRAAYNRAQYLEERRRMMQSWADYLDGLKNGAQVIAFKKAL